MNTSSPVMSFYEISLQNMFHLWNIKILRSNYKVTSRVNYGIEISSKYPLNPPMYVDYEDLTINIGYYKFHIFTYFKSNEVFHKSYTIPCLGNKKLLFWMFWSWFNNET